MNWSTVWELTKINILYSNPQTLTQLKKQHERKPNKKFSAYKSMIRQQLMLIALFTVLYLFMFIGMDFSRYPGYFSFYIGIFFIMSLIMAFTSMYTIFYESNDVKLYVYLPIKPGELYTAKIFSSLGMGIVYLMPVLSLFVLAYKDMVGWALAIPLALLLFILLIISCLTLSLYLNSLIGRIIVRSPHRKLISTLLMFASTFGAIGLILYLNMTSQNNMMEEGVLADRAALPYFRGFYDLVMAPFSGSALLNFWLPLAVIILLIVGIFKRVMPHYYQETLYTSAKTKEAVKKKTKTSSQDTSLKQFLRRHHLSTLQNATLLTQTYLLPLVFIVSFAMPSMTGGVAFGEYVPSSYFGAAFLIGLIFGVLCSLPTSFVGVGISLEKDNYTFFKSLPLNFKEFLLGKFILLVTLQAIVPAILYAVVGLLVLKFKLAIVLAFILGLVLTILVEGQLMYRRDYKLLDLKWQDMTQLFARGNGQWMIFGLMIGSFLIGGLLIALTIFISIATANPFAVNTAMILVLLLLLALAQWFLYKGFWQKIT